MTAKLVAAALALVLAGALAPAATGSAAERAGAASASAATDGGQARRTARRCRTDRERRQRRRAACARRVGVFTRQRGGAASWGVVDELEAPGESPPSDPGSPDPDAGGTTPPAPTPGPLARSLSVSAREFSFSLSRPLVDAGTVTIELRNSGEDPHNLVVSPDDGSHAPLLAFPDLDPGEYLRKSVPLAPGRYALWCSLELHEGLGMSATLRVE